MATVLRPENPSAQVIRSLLKHEHELSVYAKNAVYALPAQVTELDMESGHLVLEVEYSGKDIDHYFNNGRVNFDIETLEPAEPDEREAYSLSNVVAKSVKTDSTTYRVDCQLPESVFVKENRGAIRIPFILGMYARASLEVYPHELIINGRVRDLSVGGCKIDIPIADSIALTVGQNIPGVTLEFPNGNRFFAEGCVRHMRPFGNNGQVALGVEFINLAAAQSESLFGFVNETEREAAYRSGVNNKLTTHSRLFIASTKEKQTLRREEQERRQRERQSPMQRGVMEIAHQLQVALMYMKNRDLFPEEILYDCTDTLLYLLGQDRKALLYALAFLREEPEWVRHAVQVAAQLGDMMLIRDVHSTHVREAILGALMHTMGKPLLIGEELPSLKANATPRQKEILQTHVATLRDKLQALDWTPSPTCQDILENANERLDGSGYPAGKRGDYLSEHVRMASVIKIINKLVHERNGTPPRTPLSAYRWVNDAAGRFDKTILVEYIQCYGLYPIGSLAKFSGGFLAWIMDINGKGMPTRVHVVKNLAFSNTNIDNILSNNDFFQIGKLEDIVDPADYDIRIGTT